MEITGFMRNFFLEAFKDNKYLSYGFLTGIFRIAQESIFSGLNNLTVNSVTDDIIEKLYSLLQGARVIARIDQSVVYRSLSENPANTYSLLLVAGYLNALKRELQADGSYLCEVAIPDRKIAAVYKSEILS